MQQCAGTGARKAAALVAAVGTVVLTACAVGPDFKQPAAPASAEYTPTTQPSSTVEAPGRGGAAQNFRSGAEVPANWWTLFHADELDALIREAIAHSPTLAAAAATLRSAQENYAAQRGDALLPSVDAQGSVTRESVPGASFGQPNLPASTFTLYDASVSVAYRIDLFGGARRSVEAARAQAEYQQWEFEAARLTLINNVVTTAVNVASLHEQVEAQEDILHSEREQLAVIEKQLNAGAASRADLLSQRAQVAQSESVLPTLQKSLAQAQHRLAVLIGREPQTGSADFTFASFTLPTELPLSVPARLVRQRPDVRAAEALLHESTAQLGVATADLYPQLNLTGSIGSETVSASDLFGAGTRAWSIGGSLMQPLFHGGALTARRRAARADLDRATAQYRETVLTALQDVADTLRALEADARTLKADADGESAAADSLALTRRQYAAGAVSYVTLIVAERQYAQSRQARVQALASRYADTAALFQALGGGWWNQEKSKRE